LITRLILFFQVYNGFGFMKGLVEAMTNDDPQERPTIEDIVSRFSHIRNSMNKIKLRTFVTAKKDPSLFTVCRHTRQVVRTAKYELLRKAAIPLA
jgi:hypothetical protein